MDPSPNLRCLAPSKVADHELLFTTGDGWYKGTLGFDGGMKNIYGDQQCVIGEFHVTYEDGQTRSFPLIAHG